MSRIGTALTAGVIVYIIIVLWQAAVYPAVIGESIAIAVLLGVFGSLLAVKDPAVIKRGEMTAIWVCIGLFAIYGIMKAGGML